MNGHHSGRGVERLRVIVKVQVGSDGIIIREIHRGLAQIRNKPAWGVLNGGFMGAHAAKVSRGFARIELFKM